MNKRTTFAFLLLAASVLNCHVEEQLSPEKAATSLNSLDQSISDFLSCQGYDIEDLKFYKDHVVVEGDVVIQLDEIRKLIDAGQNLPNQKTSQYVVNTGGIATTSNVYEIPFFIDASVGPIDGDWEAAIRTATQNWEDIGNCRVSFNEVGSAGQARLIFYADNNANLPACVQNLPGNVYAAAEFPGNDQPGRWISINDNDLSDNQANRETVIRHELGHTLGFRHDNAPTFEPATPTQNCGNAVIGANQLIGTPQNDASSIMRATFATNSSFGFSSNDTKSATFLYPDGYFNYTITNVAQYYNTASTRDVVITIAYNPVGMYRFFVDRTNPWGGSVLQTQEHNQPYTTYSLQNVPLGSCRLRLRSQNYRGDFSITGPDYPITIQ